MTGTLDEILKKTIREVIREELGKTSEELLSPEELALKLKVPISWVYENSRLGNIPTHRIGKYIRFKLDEVLKKNGGPNGKD